MLRTEPKRNRFSLHRDVTLGQRRDAIRVGLTHVSLGADPKPGQVEQPDRNRRYPLSIQGVEHDVLAHCEAEIR